VNVGGASVAHNNVLEAVAGPALDAESILIFTHWARRAITSLTDENRQLVLAQFVDQLRGWSVLKVDKTPADELVLRILEFGQIESGQLPGSYRRTLTALPEEDAACHESEEENASRTVGGWIDEPREESVHRLLLH
jgi:hypothetical protein